MTSSCPATDGSRLAAMTTKERRALQAFGRLLVEEVRDRTIVDWDKLVDGTMKGDRAPKVRALVKQLGPAEIEVLKTIVPAVVDTTLHHLAFALEQQDRKEDEAVSVTCAS